MTKREIKFRVWSEMTESYLPNRSELIWRTGENVNVLDVYPVEQYTGLKDAVGVEIYEGDIIQERTTHGTPVITGVVSYYNGAFRLESAGMFSGNVIEMDSVYNQFLVIGNVHERPDLLGE